MDIDLLVTDGGQAGLLSSENFVKKAVGLLFDHESGLMSLEFADMDHLDLNIPVEPEFFETLDANAQIHIGSVMDGKIAQAYQIPLMFLNDPYRAEAFEHVLPPARPLAAFYYFVKNCRLGQPVHRADAGNEETAGCILGDNAPSSLEFAKHLARRHGMEAVQQKIAAPNAPGLGLSGSAGGGSSGGGQSSTYRGGINSGSQNYRGQPQQNKKKDDDQ